MYFIVFNLYVFYCFMISAVWDLHLDQYQAELMIYRAKRGTKLLIYRPKCKIHFAICFCTQNEKILTFRVDLWSQKVTWLRNGRSDFRKLGVKISARLQRKKSWSGAAESAAVLRARQNLSGGGGGGGGWGGGEDYLILLRGVALPSAVSFSIGVNLLKTIWFCYITHISHRPQPSVARVGIILTAFASKLC